MAKLLILGPTGSGKSTSFRTLNPETTFIISCSEKGLPWGGWKKQYHFCDMSSKESAMKGNYIRTDIGSEVADYLNKLLGLRPDIETYVIDDLNYVMGKYYMRNSKASGYTTFNNIGFFMEKILTAIDNIVKEGKNVIVAMHMEDAPGGAGYYKGKTAGKAVDNYLSIEGGFLNLFHSKARFDMVTSKPIYELVTRPDGEYMSAKTPDGMFEEVYIPNDAQMIIDTINKYDEGE